MVECVSLGLTSRLSRHALASSGCRCNLSSWPSPSHSASDIASARSVRSQRQEKIAGGLTWPATVAGAISIGILTWAVGHKPVRRKRLAPVALCADESDAMPPTGDEHFDSKSIEMNEWARIAEVERTKKMFYQLEEYGIPTTNNWNRVLHNTVLKAYANAGDYQGACSWVELMDKKGIDMNEKALGKLFSAAARDGNIDVAEVLFPKVLAARRHGRGPRCRMILWTMLLDAFAKRGRWEQALQGLKTMKSTSTRTDDQVYGACINACSKAKRPEKAQQLFDEMLQAGVQASVVTYNSMVDAQGQGGSHAEAAKLLKDMIAQDVEPNVATFGAMINACSKEVKKEPGQGDALVKEAVEYLREMKKRALQPGVAGYTATIDTMANASYMQDAKKLLQMKFAEGVKFDETPFTAIINGHKRAGQIDEAAAVFEHMQSQSVPGNLQAYTSLIDALAVGGRASEATVQMERMEDAALTPNVVTHTCLIKAHARSQDIGSALDWLQVMKYKGVSPNAVSYNCILRCPAASADTAMLVVQDMVANRVHPNAFGEKLLEEKLGKDRFKALAAELQLKVVDHDEHLIKNEGYIERRRQSRLRADGRSSTGLH